MEVPAVHKWTLTSFARILDGQKVTHEFTSCLVRKVIPIETTAQRLQRTYIYKFDSHHIKQAVFVKDLCVLQNCSDSVRGAQHPGQSKQER